MPCVHALWLSLSCIRGPAMAENVQNASLSPKACVRPFDRKGSHLKLTPHQKNGEKHQELNGVHEGRNTMMTARALVKTRTHESTPKSFGMVIGTSFRYPTPQMQSSCGSSLHVVPHSIARIFPMTIYRINSVQRSPPRTPGMQCGRPNCPKT